MDNIEFSLLSEVCSINYSELLTAIYSKYKRSTDYELLPVQGLLSSENDIKERLKSKPVPQYQHMQLHKKIFALLNDYDFKSHFSVSKTTVEALIQLFDKRHHEKKWMGRPSMEVSRMVLISIWFLVSNEPYRLLCERFSIAIGHSNQTVRFFLSTLASMKGDYITWPKGLDAHKAELEFVEVSDTIFPGVIGCIHSCQVKARRNKSRIFSFVIMQVVSDAKGKFTDVYCGEASQLSDTRTFNNSDLGKRMLSRPKSLFKAHTHILGDTGYPLLHNMLTPYSKTQLTLREKQFNHLITTYRQVVISAMAALFGRFKRLGFLDLFKTEELSNAVTSACVIHNICIDTNDPPPELSSDFLLEANEIFQWENEPVGALEKRDKLADQIFSLQS